MNDTTSTNNVTDVDFKEVKPTPEVKADSGFQPVDYLSQSLLNAGHPEPTAWTLHIDPRAVTAEDEKERIFFANRALRLYIAEHTDQENVTPRMLVSDGIDATKWAALADQGIVPWLMGKFADKTAGKEEPKAYVPVDLELTEAEKHDVRAFIARGDMTNMRLRDNTIEIAKIHRNGQNAIEWSVVGTLVHHPLPHSALVPAEPADVGGSTYDASAVKTDMPTDEVPEGSMDSLPGSITE